MITAAGAAIARRNLLMQMSRDITHPPVIQLPEVEPETPTKWVVLKDKSICPAGGGVTLVKAGTQVDDIVQMMTLAQNDVELAAIE